MIRTFLKEYNEWKKTHRQEVQEAALRKEAVKTPLNYQVLDQMFQIWTSKNQKDAVMEIKGADFVVKCYYDQNGNFQRMTSTERILSQYKG